MDPAKLQQLLNSVAAGEVSAADAAIRLRSLPFEDIGDFAKVDHHRALRQGRPETIYSAGKTPEQVVAIAQRMVEHGSNVLITRCSSEVVEAVVGAIPEAKFHEAARCITVVQEPEPSLGGYVAVVCAGTSDIPVGEEAAVTAEFYGNTVRRIYDVGVAGLHRVLEQRDAIDSANVVIVCAGMEGALASVVAGLVDKPVLAVPTSVGYGAAFNGLAALLGMLNSCASGVSVCNIDNGYGAGVNATIINRIANGKHRP